MLAPHMAGLDAGFGWELSWGRTLFISKWPVLLAAWWPEAGQVRAIPRTGRVTVLPVQPQGLSICKGMKK